MTSKSLECSHATGARDESCDLVAGLETDVAKAGKYVESLQERLRAAEAQIAKAMSLLKPACAEENLEGAIRNLQQAHQSERCNAETLEREVEELRVYVTHVENDNEAFLKENKEAAETLTLANAELLRNESRIAELARCLSSEKCSYCGRLYSVDPNTGMWCKLADHIEAYDAISGKAA
jgi:chromosome segregation ATPase